MAAPNSHPLPPPPPPQQVQYSSHQDHFYHHQSQQQQQPQYYQPQQQQRQPQPPPARPHPERSQTKSRSYSLHSDRSNKSGGARREHLHETSAEKEAKRLHSKADPTLAMNEAEPSAVAAMSTSSSLAPLRSIQHKDPFGNPIADPDRSNPTRSRWERPLDTIRSFEAAIDGPQLSKSYVRSDTESVTNWNRRGSYYGSNGPRFPRDSYYGGRPPSFPPESSQFDLSRPGRDSYYEGSYNGNQYNGNQYNGGGYGAGPGRQRPPRMASEPQFQTYGRSEQPVYPIQHKDRSYETVTSAAGSGSMGDQAGYQTDPTSSDNSSIDRISPTKRVDHPVNDYGIGFSQSPMYQPPAFSFGANGNSGPVPNHMHAPNAYDIGAPPVPRKDQTAARRPTAPQRPEMPEKRKSWFSRRFSKAI